MARTDSTPPPGEMAILGRVLGNGHEVMSADLARHVAAFREVLRQRPANAAAWSMLGQQLRNRGELKEAVSALRRLRSHPRRLHRKRG